MISIEFSCHPFMLYHFNNLTVYFFQMSSLRISVETEEYESLQTLPRETTTPRQEYSLAALYQFDVITTNIQENLLELYEDYTKKL